MINVEDQEALFKLIAEYIEQDIECVAIGGTAMMFAGYKTVTKDIDIVFNKEKDRKIFVKAIEELGYTERSIKGVYDKKRTEHKGKPKMFSRGEERFDLFVEDVFGVKINHDITERNDFIGKKTLIIKILPKEDLILLKAVTNREKDMEDIESIFEKEKNIDWNRIVDYAISQKNNNPWILYDLEEKMQILKKKTFIKKEFFEKIYKEESKSQH
jgi:predicted nucleotidyltransferase